VAFTPGPSASILGERPATVVPVEPADIPALRTLHQQESVRFLRPRNDWEMAFDCGVVMNTASDFWGITLDSAPAGAAGVDAPNPQSTIHNPQSLLAYLICHQPDKIRRRNPDDPRLVRVVEFGGDRAAVLAAVPRLLEHYSAGRLTLHVQGTDAGLLAHLHLLGVAPATAGSSGTLRVINFPQVMERCRPLLAERIGAAAARDLRFEADQPPGSTAGGFTIRRGAEALRIPDLAALAEFLFGSPQRRPVPTEGSPSLAGLMAEALPLPTLWYGINYV
jgi:hypothetical protein